MSQPQEKTAGPVTELPNPELNPLLNPTLGQNLGRWAQVYFTTPPEKREEAVLELLRELQADPGTGKAEPFEQAPTAIWPQSAEEVPLAPAGVQCAECGYQNTKQQRFCGMCGASLALNDVAMPPLTQHPGVQENLSDKRVPLPSDQEAAFSTLSLFRTAESPSTQTREVFSDGIGESQIQWLRDRNLRETTVAPEPGHSLKYVLAVVAVLLVGVFFYAETRSQSARPTNSAETSTATPTPAPAASLPTTTPTKPQTSGVDEAAISKAAVSNPAPTSQPSAREIEPQSHSAAVRNLTSVQVDDPSSSSSGTAELAVAETFLSGKNGARDSAEAAKFLWKAVGKENIRATLLLSDLYRTGDGVTKSCDQARLLLDAAAQRNSPQAADKLRELQRTGCR